MLSLRVLNFHYAVDLNCEVNLINKVESKRMRRKRVAKEMSEKHSSKKFLKDLLIGSIIAIASFLIVYNVIFNL